MIDHAAILSDYGQLGQSLWHLCRGGIMTGGHGEYGCISQIRKAGYGPDENLMRIHRCRGK
jgi:hypothetical protein